MSVEFDEFQNDSNNSARGKETGGEEKAATEVVFCEGEEEVK